MLYVTLIYTFFYCEIGEHSPVLKFQDFSGSRIFLDPGLSWKLDGLKWVYKGVTLHMNLISLRNQKLFSPNSHKRQLLKQLFENTSVPFIGVLQFFKTFVFLWSFFCLFVSLAFLWPFCLIVATLLLCCHFVAHLPFCGSFAYFKILCKQYSDVTLTHQKTEGAEF